MLSEHHRKFSLAAVNIANAKLLFPHLLQTAALDGETDLKTRIIPSICADLSPEQLGKVKVNLSVLLLVGFFSRLF